MKLLTYDEWFDKFEKDLEKLPTEEGKTFEELCEKHYKQYKKSVEEYLDEKGEFNRYSSL